MRHRFILWLALEKYFSPSPRTRELIYVRGLRHPLLMSVLMRALTYSCLSTSGLNFVAERHSGVTKTPIIMFWLRLRLSVTERRLKFRFLKIRESYFVRALAQMSQCVAFFDPMSWELALTSEFAYALNWHLLAGRVLRVVESFVGRNSNLSSHMLCNADVIFKNR